MGIRPLDGCYGDGLEVFGLKRCSLLAVSGVANVFFGVSTVSERPLRHPMYEGYQRPYIGFIKFRASLWEFG